MKYQIEELELVHSAILNLMSRFNQVSTILYHCMFSLWTLSRRYIWYDTHLFWLLPAIFLPLPAPGWPFPALALEFTWTSDISSSWSHKFCRSFVAAQCSYGHQETLSGNGRSDRPKIALSGSWGSRCWPPIKSDASWGIWSPNFTFNSGLVSIKFIRPMAVFYVRPFQTEKGSVFGPGLMICRIPFRWPYKWSELVGLGPSRPCQNVA